VPEAVIPPSPPEVPLLVEAEESCPEPGLEVSKPLQLGDCVRVRQIVSVCVSKTVVVEVTASAADDKGG
jgi:hypothetical protein